MKRDDFFHEIAKEKERKPLILSLIEPHSSMFAESNDHLPTPLQCIFNPAHLDKDYDQLVTLANNFSMHTVTQEMLEHLAKMTCDQDKSKQWLDLGLEESLLHVLSKLSVQILTNPHYGCLLS